MIAPRIPAHPCSVPLLVVAALLVLVPGRASAQISSGERVTGSGVVRTETRNVSSFHSIVVGVPAKVNLRQGDTESLSISGDDNIVPRVETIVEDGTLKIRWAGRGDYFTNFRPLEIVVDARAIDGLTICGSGQIHAGRLKATTLRTTIDSSGAIGLDALEAESVYVAIHGNGSVMAAGRADSLDLTIAGQVSAARLESRRARITLQGSGRATVWANDDLNATIAGSGRIAYYGKPQLSQTIAGSGSVRYGGGAS